MGGENRSTWWTTLPGLLTALAAIITAVTGLVVGLNQIGVFGTAAPPPASPAVTRDGVAPSGDRAGTASNGGRYEATLPLDEPIRSGAVSYEIVGYEVRRDTDDALALSMDIRMTNHDRFDANFWDASFRLTVGEDTGDTGDTIAPSGGLNELVPGDSSKVGTVLFVVPDTTGSATLKVKFLEGDRSVPFELRHS